MKLKSLFLLLAFYGITTVTQGQNCARTVDWGTIKICLPLIDGMTECYTDPAVKKLADQTESPNNEEIGYYLTTSDYQNLGSVDSMKDYCKLYGVKSIKNVKAGTKEMSQLDEQFKNMYTTSTWEEINKKAEQQLDSIDISELVMLESFKTGKEANTYIFYSEVSTDTRTVKMVMSVSFMLVNERIICLAYYTTYRDAGTQQVIRSKVENALRQIFTVNP